MGATKLRIEPVRTRRELKSYIMFPFVLYRSDPNWVPPLIGERYRHFDPKHNPFLNQATVQLFRAIRGETVVGVIAAIDDPQHNQVWNENVGFFGEFETIDDQEVASQLFGAARDWLARRGRPVMRGPMNLNVNEECGLLIEGFDGRPVLMMTYNPPYYARLLERYGFVKAKDLYAYYLDIDSYGPNLEHLPEQVVRVAHVAEERYGVTIRKIDLKRLDTEIELIKPIHRQAWNRNWGALPMSDGQYQALGEALTQIADPDIAFLAFIDGRPIGCFLALPDYNQVVYHMKGRLLPFGWAKALWYRHKIDGLRVIIMGVLEEHRLKGVESLFYREGCKVAVQKGYKWAEMSWILEDNYRVRRGIENMGGRIYRTYRIFDFSIG